MSGMLTIDEIIALEPEVKLIIEDAKAFPMEYRLSPHVAYCFRRHKSEKSLSMRVNEAVGWQSGNPSDSILGSSEAYDLVRDAVLQALRPPFSRVRFASPTSTALEDSDQTYRL